VSSRPDGKPGSGPSTRPSISADGTRIAFRSGAPDLVDTGAGDLADTNGQVDAFLRDTSRNMTRRVNMAVRDAKDGTRRRRQWFQSMLPAEAVTIAPDGASVFVTTEQPLLSGDWFYDGNSAMDVYRLPVSSAGYPQMAYPVSVKRYGAIDPPCPATDDSLCTYRSGTLTGAGDSFQDGRNPISADNRVVAFTTMAIDIAGWDQWAEVDVQTRQPYVPDTGPTDDPSSPSPSPSPAVTVLLPHMRLGGYSADLHPGRWLASVTTGKNDWPVVAHTVLGSAPTMGEDNVTY
jgi:hypothetical protein